MIQLFEDEFKILKKNLYAMFTPITFHKDNCWDLFSGMQAKFLNNCGVYNRD